MAEQNKKIDDFVEISLRPFRKTDGSVVLVAQDGMTINLSDSDGNVLLALNDYYKKSQTYSQTQVNNILGNYYTQTESQSLFVVSGQTAPGPIIVNDGGSYTIRVTEDGFFVYDGTDYTQLGDDTLVFHKNSAVGYNPTTYTVANISGSSNVFLTDSNGDWKLRNGTVYVNEISDDGTLTANSDSILPTQKSVKTYVDNVVVGTIPVTGSSSDFNVNGVLTFSSGNAIDGTAASNEITFQGATTNDSFTLSFTDSESDDLSQFIIQPQSVVVANSSGSAMLTITPTLSTFVGGISADSITLNSGETVYQLSSASFDASGSFTEDQIVPTQAGVRAHVIESAVSTVSGGTVGTGSSTITIVPENVIISDGNNTTVYDEDGIVVTSAMSGDAFTVTTGVSGGPTYDAITISGDGYIKLANGVSVNEISTDTTFSADSDSIIPTQKAVKEFVTSLAGITTNSIAGTSHTVTVSAGEVYIGCDTSSGPFTLTMPASPDDGLRVWAKDEDGNAAANNITVNGNGNNIDGLATYVMSTNGASRVFIFADSEWRVFV